MGSFVFNIGIKISRRIYRLALKRKDIEGIDADWHRIIGRLYWGIVNLNERIL